MIKLGGPEYERIVLQAAKTTGQEHHIRMENDPEAPEGRLNPKPKHNTQPDKKPSAKDQYPAAAKHPDQDQDKEWHSKGPFQAKKGMQGKNPASPKDQIYPSPYGPGRTSHTPTQTHYASAQTLRPQPAHGY
jgi:hypothetical protein